MSEETITEIRRQSPILNAKVDETNILFARREAELREANVQLTFWWETCFEEREFIDENEEVVVEYWMVGLIDGPSFGAKLMRHHQSSDTFTEVRSPIYLSQAPFQVRVQVAQDLDQFLKALAAEMSRVASRLDETLTRSTSSSTSP